MECVESCAVGAEDAEDAATMPHPLANIFLGQNWLDIRQI